MCAWILRWICGRPAILHWNFSLLRSGVRKWSVQPWAFLMYVENESIAWPNDRITDPMIAGWPTQLSDDQLNNWMTDSMIEWPAEWSDDWLNTLINWMIGWPTEWSDDRLNDRMTVWMIGWPTERLDERLNTLIDWMIEWPTEWSDDRLNTLIDWPTDWLTSWQNMLTN